MNNPYYAELEALQAKIRSNSASLADYERYEEILITNGISQEQFLSVLKRNGFLSLEDYCEQRNRAKTLNQRYITEGAALGAILGIGAGLLMYWRIKSVSKTPSQVPKSRPLDTKASVRKHAGIKPKKKRSRKLHASP